MSERHVIRWYVRSDGRLGCGTCRREITHVAFLTRDGRLVDFDKHIGREPKP